MRKVTGIWVFGAGILAACGLLVYTMAAVRPGRDTTGRPPVAAANIPGDTPRCAATIKLIPSCGAWWGVAPDVFGGLPPGKALAATEERMGRKADIVHVYHRGGDPFPTHAERRLARTRLLLVNWKPSVRHTWAEIADGAVDHRIDRLADSIKRHLPRRFFLTIHHEPENDVRPRPGSGMTADDYAAMYRHVVLRLRSQGVRNAVTVMTYMGAPNWAAKPWFERLYPGDDVVDWIGVDPYADRRADDFAALIDKIRPDHAKWPGFYRWTQTRFPAKPIMIAEWGAFPRQEDPHFKTTFFNTVRRQIRGYPQIKALVYFDSPRAPRGDTRFDTTPETARAFTELARAPYFSSTPVPGD